jgi:branched-chain amino acid transport system ATP-binding protein
VVAYSHPGKEAGVRQSGTILEAKGINLAFGAVVAARDVNVAVSDGETIGIIGANGAGKTTFVNTVTGYLKPDSGRVIYLGEDITALPPRRITRLGIRRSFQVPQLFPDLAVRDNLLIAIGIAEERRPSAWRRLDTPDRSAEADAILARMALALYRDREVAVLPQGIRKLVDIAMTLPGEPRLLLLDEPTSGISAEEKFGIMDRVMAALKETQVTVLFVEHDMEIVERHAERVIAFYDGRIIADGPTAEVLVAPDVRRYVVGSELHRRAAAGG